MTTLVRGRVYRARPSGFTDDKFFVYIEAIDPKYSAESTRSLLERTGATAIEVVED